MPRRFLLSAIIAVAAVGLSQSRASAHDLQARVTLHPHAINVEAWFSDDTPAQEAKVTIIDAGKNTVLSGQTDDTGVCKLPELGTGKYTAIVELIGHRDTVEFEIAETASEAEFTNGRLNKTLGLCVGLGGLLAVSCAFWFARRRKPGTPKLPNTDAAERDKSTDVA